MVSGTQAGTVTNTADNGTGSLRDVLSAAVDNEVIDFAPALDGATITLTTGSLGITGLTLTLDASALPSGITVSGNNNSSILRIGENEGAPRPNVTLKNLHLRNGRETADTSRNGGGIFAYQCTLSLEACSIKDCFCGINGGGFYGNGVTTSIKRCVIAGNQAESFGGGIFLIGSSSVDIASSQISGNKSPSGGGICNLAASPALSNCSIQGNSGSGLNNDLSSNPVLRNCIVWGNTADSGTTAFKQLSNYNNSHPNLASCLIEGASDPASFDDGNLVVWGSGNLDGTMAANDPQFVGAVPAANAPSSAANLRVLSSSPVWNRGNNAFGGTTLDLAGNARIQNATIDLGAYESGCDYAVWAALYADNQPAGLDFDNDSVPNGLEYFMGQTGPGFTQMPAAVNTAGVVTWAWPRDPNANAAFKFQISDTLDGTDWEDVVPPDPNINTTNPNQVIYTFGPKHFCRFVVTP